MLSDGSTPAQGSDTNARSSIRLEANIDGFDGGIVSRLARLELEVILLL
jgi:hypothetical protein